MDTAGHLTTAQLKEFLNIHEMDENRRNRLFLPFGYPRAELLNQLRDEILDFIVEEQVSLENSTVLDFGCGDQPYRKAFDQARANVIAIDIGNNPNADIQIADDNKLPFANDSFEYIISIQVLEHVPVPQEYLLECYRTLKPGGKIFLTTHGVWPYHPTPGDYHRWTEKGLVLDFERSNYLMIKTNGILNENSALILALVTNLYYHKRLLGLRKYIHHISQLIIRRSEKTWTKHSDIPAIISILAMKP